MSETHALMQILPIKAEVARETPQVFVAGYKAIKRSPELLECQPSLALAPPALAKAALTRLSEVGYGPTDSSTINIFACKPSPHRLFAVVRGVLRTESAGEAPMQRIALHHMTRDLFELNAVDVHPEVNIAFSRTGEDATIGRQAVRQWLRGASRKAGAEVEQSFDAWLSLLFRGPAR